MSSEQAQQTSDSGFRSRAVGVIKYLAIAALVVVAITVIVGYIYNWYWTGLTDYTKIVTVGTDERVVFQRSKTLWDWLSLAVVPLGLALVAIWFSKRARENEQEIADKNREADLSVAEGNRAEDRETAQEQIEQKILDGYFDRMSDLLLKHGLTDREAHSNSLVRKIARTRTLTVLQSLNYRRKGLLVRFLYETRLIDKDPIIPMNGVDLETADLASEKLEGADLSESYLNEAILTEANLARVNLHSADLSYARLTDASITGADLSEADLSYAILFRTKLKGTDLSGATLIAADLRLTDLSDVILEDIEYNSETLWPEGFSPPEEARRIDVQAEQEVTSEGV